MLRTARSHIVTSTVLEHFQESRKVVVLSFEKGAGTQRTAAAGGSGGSGAVVLLQVVYRGFQRFYLGF